jgi:hypothetical protein
MDTMRSSVKAVAALLLGASAGVLLIACGSSTKTVSVAGTPAISQTTGTQTQRSGSTPAAPPATSKASPGGGTAGPTGTRTAPEPAFTEKEHHTLGLSDATTLLRETGFTPTSTSDYHPGQALRVLIGTRTGSRDGYGQQAFFFVNERYVGTDAKDPSATVSVVSQNDTEVTLAYPLYRKGDPLGSPSGGRALVRFQLNNGKLAPLDPIPPASSSSSRPGRN